MLIKEKLFNFIQELGNYEFSTIEHNGDEMKKSADYFSEELLDEANEVMKIEIPEKDYQYDSISTFILDWESTTSESNEEYLWGGYKIIGISEALAFPSHFWEIYNDSRFYKNNAQKEEAIYKEFLPQLSYFQKSGHGDDGTFGCFYLEEGVYPPKIYFYDSGIWFPMSLSLEEYYDKMMECKAVYYWQYFFIDTEIIVKKLANFKPIYIEAGAQYIEGPAPFMDKYKDGTFVTSLDGVLYQMEVILKRFPKMFNGYDVTFFKQRYELLKKAYEKSK